MKTQNYKNHRKFYAPHHFVLLPALLILIVMGVRNYFITNGDKLPWLLFTISICCILYLAVMLRQHYALGNQDRIIRLEFKLRYFELFGERSSHVEKKLSFSQIAALRFADDKEFVMLVNKVQDEKLSGDQIKRAIKNWQPDHERV